MGLAASIQAAAALAFRAADDLVVSRRVRHTPTPSYNPATDTQTLVWAFDQDVPLVGYQDDPPKTEDAETDNPDIRVKNFVFLAAGITIPLNGVAEVDDGGIVWKSYRVEKDPAGATYILYCRA
jgi:hypothetical protein